MAEYRQEILEYIDEHKHKKKYAKYFKPKFFNLSTKQEMNDALGVQDWENHEWPNIRQTSKNDSPKDNYEEKVMNNLIKQGKEISKKYLIHEKLIQKNQLLTQLVNIFLGAISVPLNRFPYGDYVARTNVLTQITNNVNSGLVSLELQAAFQLVLDYVQGEVKIDSDNISKLCQFSTQVALEMDSVCSIIKQNKSKNFNDISEQVYFYLRKLYKFHLIDSLLKSVRFGCMTNPEMENFLARGLFIFQQSDGLQNWVVERQHLWRPEAIINELLNASVFARDREFLPSKNCNLALLKLVQYCASYALTCYKVGMEDEQVTQFILSVKDIYLCLCKLDLNQVGDVLKGSYFATLSVINDYENFDYFFDTMRMNLNLIGQCFRAIECLLSMKLYEFKTKTGYSSLTAIIISTLCSLVVLFESIREIESGYKQIGKYYDSATDSATKSCM